MSGIYISDIYTLDTNLIHYVNDPDDAQILQDAVSIHADFLLSRNIKDFDIASIQQDLHIHVIGYIPDFLLE
jgi:predicted nucleic acid-binding protein